MRLLAPPLQGRHHDYKKWHNRQRGEGKLLSEGDGRGPSGLRSKAP